MRLIDADALKKEMLETYEQEYPTTSGAFDEFASRIVPNIISNAPTIDAEPVVHGHWGNYEPDLDGYRCSRCKLVHRTCTTYCPNCGAKMDEVSE